MAETDKTPDLTAEQIERITHDVVARVTQKLAGIGFGGGGAGYHCTDVFRCAAYDCVAPHGCKNVFDKP